MPTLFRLLVILAVLGAALYGAMFGLAHFVEPKPRQITITVPQDKLAKPH
jgi:SNF family Na+-dependent transporter